jgi:NAD(P)H-dependent FMN reductase
MASILGISGSLRRASFNTALLQNAVQLMPADSTLSVRTLHSIPLYNADEEAEGGVPASVAALKEAIVSADGVILATPEYNNSIPGVFKNAIDWASRPPADIKRVFGGKPVAILGASPGRFGTVLSQNAWLAVLRTLGMKLWVGGRLVVPGAGKVFDANGTLVDDTVRQQLRDFVAGFVVFVSQR